MIEVLKQALEALETELFIDWTNDDEFNASAEKMHDAITSLRQAIAELESQEPVAWIAPRYEGGHDMVVADLAIDKDNTVSVYCERDQTTKVEAMFSTPPQRTWQGLTDEDKHYLNEVLNLQGRFPIIEAIEAKLKDKNND